MAECVENISISETGLLPGREEWTPSSGQLVLPMQYLRAGIFTPWSRSADGVTWTSGGGRGIVVSPPGGYLTLRDALLLGVLGQRFLSVGNWDDRVVTLSLSECARAMGYGTGSWYRRQAAESVRRLTAALLTWERRGVDTKGRPVLERCDWHVLDANQTRINPAEGGVRMRLSEETADLLAEGYLTFLTSSVARSLVNADDVAARLWMFLASEKLSHDFSYPLLRNSASPGQHCIAEIVGIAHWRTKRNVKTRIAKAIKNIEALDGGRYGLCLRTNDQGVTYLNARRTSRRALKSRE